MRPVLTLRLLALLCAAEICSGALAESRRASAPASAVSAECARFTAPLESSIAFSPLESALFDLAAEHRLDNGNLLWGAFVASGLDESAVKSYEQRFVRLASQLKRVVADAESDGQPLGERRRAELAFEFLHHEILRGDYDIDCTSLAECLDSGRYNCISATVLYNCLAAAVELPASAVVKPGHVLSVVNWGGAQWEVETTCPRWFELLDDPRRRAEFSPPTAKAEPRGASGEQPAARTLDANGLLALVYYNRGVDHVEQEEFAGAVGANLKALRLDPRNVTARGNLHAAINNWALDLAQRRRFADALALIQQGRRLAPGHATFAINHVALSQQWVDAMCREGRFAEALQTLQQAVAEAPESPKFVVSSGDIYRRWAASLAAGGRVEESLQLLADARRRLPEGGKLANADIDMIVLAAQACSQRGDTAQAVALYERGLLAHPGNPVLLRRRREVIEGRQVFAERRQ